MRVGFCQINTTVGDFPSNARRILSAYRECLEQGADIVLTPELALVGYPPGDLLFSSLFLEKNLQALDYLSSEIGSTPLIVGCILPSNDPTRFLNAAVWIENGKIVHQRAKTCLPSHDVFDEPRYFSPAEQNTPIQWKNHTIGITLCEDIWSPLSAHNPAQSLVKQGAQVLFNLSASPFTLEKPAQRMAQFLPLCQQLGVPLCYCNAIGAQDALLFDGRSLFFNAKGHCVTTLTPFQEDTKVIDINNPQPTSLPPRSESQECYEALCLGIADYMRKNKLSSVCLGLSGGVDSALCALLATDALGANNVEALTLPSPYSSKGSITDSLTLANNLGIPCQTVPITQSFDILKTTCQSFGVAKQAGIVEENLQARIRGILLMALSNETSSLLLTTGNKSEMAVGYATAYGDMCGGLAPLGDLSKTRVYALCQWLNAQNSRIPQSILDKAPSAELRPNQKDQDTLPDYPILDAILHALIEEELSCEDCIERYTFDANTVRWVARRIKLNEWKRSQAPVILKLTSKAFGQGRRIPIAHAFFS